MKLFLLGRVDVDGGGYDEAEGFVVRAPSSRTARQLAEQASGGSPAGFWLDPKRSTCERLHAEGAAGVILRDYRAG